jgi:hypothetical protein
VFHLTLNLGDLTALEERLLIKADVLLERAAEDLAVQTHAFIVEQAALKLHSTRSTYVEALSLEPTGTGAWVIELDKSVMWIEEGMPRHEMIDDLLRNGSKFSAKTGARYRVIPFPIRTKTQTPAGAQIIRKAAQDAIRSAGINMKEIEREVDGRVKRGALHAVENVNHPLRTGNGPYQGHGPHHHPRQGMSGSPFLKGLRVMQSMTKSATPIVQKTAMTFRVVSSLHKGTGRWVHPGIKAAKLIDAGFDWANKEWDSKIKPEVLAALAAT